MPSIGSFFLVYQDEYLTGQKYVMHVPTRPYDASDTNQFNNLTLEQATISIPWFDHTFYLSWGVPAVETWLLEKGFASVAGHGDAPPMGHRYYIAEGYSIEVISGNHYTYRTPTGTYEHYPTGSWNHACTPIGPNGTYMSASYFQVSGNNIRSAYWDVSSSHEWAAEFWAHSKEPSTDPYEWAGHTHTSGKIPDEQHQITQENIDFPSLPTISVGDAGFISIWTPTLEQVQRLAGYMWCNNPLIADFWLKLLASPLDLIFGLSIIPVDLTDPGSPYTLKHAGLVLGYVATLIDMNYIDEQFIEVDMGSVDVKEWAGAYLDYDPYTKFSIYLPYIGARDINADDIMDRTISLKYRIDLATGACVAMIKCTDPNGVVDSVFYSFSGNCAAQVPVTASQQQELIKSIINIGTSIAQVAAGAPAPNGILDAAVKGAGAIGVGAISSAQHALGLKSNYAHSGVMDSTVGFLGPQQPYLIVNRPRLAIPEDQNVYMGYPSFITETLGDLSGYTEVEVLHLDRIPCTEVEMSEIAELLVGGVYF